MVILLHPDPQKVVLCIPKLFRMYKLFINAGFSTIRFNFRGVGKVKVFLMMVRANLVMQLVYWIGYNNIMLTQNMLGCRFSFSAWIAMQLLMRRPEINGFVSVLPQQTLEILVF